MISHHIFIRIMDEWARERKRMDPEIETEEEQWEIERGGKRGKKKRLSESNWRKSKRDFCERKIGVGKRTSDEKRTLKNSLRALRHLELTSRGYSENAGRPYLWVLISWLPSCRHWTRVPRYRCSVFAEYPEEVGMAGGETLALMSRCNDVRLRETR